jgi:hypothetical protein
MKESRHELALREIAGGADEDYDLGVTGTDAVGDFLHEQSLPRFSIT